MDIHIERPVLNAKTPEENIAKIDTWIADTADKMNILIRLVNEKSSLSESGSATIKK